MLKKEKPPGPSKEKQEDIREKDFIKKLYNLFIFPPNPNNPRYRKVLTQDSYTFRFLSERMKIPSSEIKKRLRNIAGIQIIFDKVSGDQIFYINDKTKFKEYICHRYNEMFPSYQPVKNQPVKDQSVKVSALKEVPQFSHHAILPSESIQKKFTPQEIEYLRFILEYNPTGEFSISHPQIPKTIIKEKKFNKGKMVALLNKCIRYGLVEKGSGGKYRFTNLDFTPYF